MIHRLKYTNKILIMWLVEICYSYLRQRRGSSVNIVINHVLRTAVISVRLEEYHSQSCAKLKNMWFIPSYLHTSS
jgi:hypothetical protein